ncbi:MAG TPA: SprT family zinc-dependent metalloprotease [Verrucomicrobiae bacterium]|jgi:hypothetical protein|nr:SprT family zinc-dependent metalloprotease [Verrucomicrobiae bacterium]
MTQHNLIWGGARIVFQLWRTDRRTLAITVRPDMMVLVTAPRGATLEKVMEKVRKRARWIRRQLRFFQEFLPQTPPKKYLGGETHRYLGRQYRLKVVKAERPGVMLKGRFIWVETSQKNGAFQVRELVRAWYLARARERFSRSLVEGVARLGKRLAVTPRVQIRSMPKRWGSWTRRGVVLLNPELVKAPVACIDYVVTHELCHSVHKHHSNAFYTLLRRVMPDWETRKMRLERALVES